MSRSISLLKHLVPLASIPPYIYAAPFSMGTCGNAVPAPILPSPRLCLLMYIVYFIWVCNTICDNAFPNLKCYLEPLFIYDTVLLIVIVNSIFLQRTQKRSRGNQLIHRRLSKTK